MNGVDWLMVIGYLLMVSVARLCEEFNSKGKTPL